MPLEDTISYYPFSSSQGLIPYIFYIIIFLGYTDDTLENAGSLSSERKQFNSRIKIKMSAFVVAGEKKKA